MTDTSLILIVDDNLLLQRAAVRVLSQAGYRTCTADDGQAALRLARSEKPDLILLDVVLPDISGLEVCRQIKTDPALTGCFIVLLSSTHVDSSSQIEGLEGGADGYIARPIPNDELLARVRGLLRIKQAEDRLRESETRYKSLFENNHAIMLIIDPDSAAIIDVNPAACAYYGWSREELLQKRIDEINTLTTEEVKSEMQLARAEKRNHFFLKHRRADDSIRDVEVHGGPLILAGKTLLFSMVHDITERKRAEEEIQQNESRLRRLVDILQHSSETIQEFLDYALDQAIQLTGSKIGYIYHYHEDRKQFVLNTWSKEVMAECAIANPPTCYKLDKTGIWGEAVRQRRPIIVNDFQAAHPLKKGYPEGHVQLLKFMTVPIFKGDHIVGVVGLANKETDYAETDILQVSLLMETIWKVTERKQAEEALWKSEKRFRTLFEQAAVGVSLLETKTGRYVDINQRYCDFLGYTLEEMLDSKLQAVTHPDDVQTNLDNNALLITGKIREFSIEKRYIRKDGRVVWGNLTASSLWAAGEEPETYFHIAVVQDITERKRAEEALRELNATLEQRVADRTRRLYEANAQLSELDRLKDQFISRISHELRTPLTNIISYLDLLENGKPEKRARYLQVLHEQAALLRELIESLLEVTQKSVNAAGVHVAPTDLNQLATSLLTEATPRAAQRGLALASALMPELPFVSADGRLLAQALSKLVTNALNYTPTGGTIDLATAEVIDAGATWITFTIRDSGPGIAPDELAHIFDRFYRGRAAADYKTPGAGVGLSISRDILTSLDGRLTADSQPGEGATFTAWLKPA